MIDIDMSGAIPVSLVAYLESEGLTESILDSVIESARAKWIRLAQTELKSSRQSYIDGIGEIEIRPGSRVIVLTGWMANAVETGLDPYDLRETLLGPGSKSRRPIMADGGGQIGWYANIPFRHGTPGSTGLAGTPMGAAYGPRGGQSRAVGSLLDAKSAGEFGSAIYAAAKSLRTKTKARKAVKLKEAAVAAAFSSSGGRGSPLLAQHHKSSIYAGMAKVRKPYANPRTGKTTTQSQYQTFRRISTTNETGWMHPGIEPRRLMDKVGEHIEQLIPRVIAAGIRGATKK